MGLGRYKGGYNKENWSFGWPVKAGNGVFLILAGSTLAVGGGVLFAFAFFYSFVLLLSFFLLFSSLLSGYHLR